MLLSSYITGVGIACFFSGNTVNCLWVTVFLSSPEQKRKGLIHYPSLVFLTYMSQQGLILRSVACPKQILYLYVPHLFLKTEGR